MYTLKRIFNNLYFLSFLNGILLTSLFYFKVQSGFEDGLFSSISRNVRQGLKVGDTNDSIVVRSLHVCYRLMHNRASVFGGDDDGNNFLDLLHPVTVDLMTTKGACGSYSAVLARLLSTEGYPVRIAQMKAGGFFGAHNLVEVNTGKQWEVLDPTYDLYFTRPDRKIASFADVRNSWSYYIPQLPAAYNLNYRYEDVRYTNWQKVPFFLPAVKKALDLAFGASRADTISLHVYFLKTYKICFYALLVLSVVLSVHTGRRVYVVSGLSWRGLGIFPGKSTGFLSPSGTA